MPDVIEHRKKTLSNQDNETLIAGDLFDMRWADEVPTDRPVMILLLGVFQYFHEEEIVDIIGKMKGRFPGAELVFDSGRPPAWPRGY